MCIPNGLQTLKTNKEFFLLTLPYGEVMPDSEILIYPNFFSTLDSNMFFQELLDNISWKQDEFSFDNKNIAIPRLTAWYGDSGKVYCYSGMTKYPESWIPELLTIKLCVEEAIQSVFNSVLLNLYRHGKDRVSWHSDDEPELGVNPVIASISFGETRRFQFRHKFDTNIERVTVNLTHGSLLVMRGNTQHYWQHQLPEGRKSLKTRINLTFRFIN
jgi:alkylated DNA repair dioxygenase AlkB